MDTTKRLKAGTRVELTKGDFGTVVRWHAISGKREEVPGYHRIRFDDGGMLLVHISALCEVAA